MITQEQIDKLVKSAQASNRVINSACMRLRLSLPLSQAQIDELVKKAGK